MCVGDGYPATEVLDEGNSPCLSKLFYLMVDVNAYTLLKVNQRLNAFFREGMPRMGSSLAEYWGYLDASLAWSTLGSLLRD